MPLSAFKPWYNRLNTWLWHTPSPELTPPLRLLRRICRVCYAVLRDLTQGHTNLYAMGLVYGTLLAVVPFLALSFSVLKSFGVHNQLEPLLQNLLLAPLGSRGQEIIDNVLSFVDNIQVRVLGAVGLGLLVFTVLSLVQKVDRAFNETWRVHQSRPITQKLSNYLSVTLIGPLLGFSALGATATLVSSDTVHHLLEVAPLGWLYSILTRLAPYAFIIVLFTFLYVLIPNTRVRLGPALIGGFVAGITWQSVGYLFTVFVAGSGRFTAIYSGFAVGVLLLVWIYLAWLILLTGASVAYYSQHAHQITPRRNNRPSAQGDEQLGLALMYRIAHRFDQGLNAPTLMQLVTSSNADPEATDRLIKKLLKHHLLVRTEYQGLVPAKPLDQISLTELLGVLRASDQPPLTGPGQNAQVRATLKELEEALAEHFDQRSLEDWVRITGD